MNYYDTFMEVADDCPVTNSEIPQQRGNKKSIPIMQFEMIAKHPYKYTQEDVLFEVFAESHGISEENKSAERKKFFSKGQPCLRSSALGKRYGWGIHYNKEGKVALYAVESDEYKKFMGDKTIKHLKAMRSKRI